MPIKARSETLSQLTEADKAALKAIYTRRCLDEPLLQRFFYQAQDNGQNCFTQKRIQWFVRQELLGIDEYGEDQCAFYLTNRGLQTVRELYDRPLYTIDPKTGHRKYEVTSKGIRPAPILLNHQMHLNALSLDIETRCHLPEDSYKDCKFASNFTYAQPDGVFELPDLDLFLEMDMAHERVADLKRKWQHYRNYRSAREYYLKRNKPMVVLFATENIKRGYAFRRSKVIQSITATIFDLIGDTFECYIGPAAEMAAVAETLLSKTHVTLNSVGAFLQSQMGFVFSKPAAIREKCGETYLYMRQLSGNRTPLVRDGRPQEFFLEDYSLRPVSVLKRAAYYGHISSLLFSVLDRKIPLLLLVPDEQAIYQDLSAADALGAENVFFTTESRLRTRLFPEALFQFDQLGNRYHFKDFSYTDRIREKKGG